MNELDFYFHRESLLQHNIINVTIRAVTQRGFWGVLVDHSYKRPVLVIHHLLKLLVSH